MTTTPPAHVEPRTVTTAPLSRWARGRAGTGGAVVAVFVVAYGSFPGPSPATGPGSLRARAVVGLAQLAMVATLLGVVVVWERATRRWGSDIDLERTSRWSARPRWRCSASWIFAAFVGAGALLLAWIPLGPFVDRLWSHGPAGTYNDLPDVRAPTVWAAVIAWVLCAPVFEELAFRGCLQSWLGRRLPRVAAVVVATAAFTWAHGFGAGAYNTVQLLSVGLSGLLYAGLFEATGSVTPGIASHMARNGSVAVSLVTGVPIALPATTAVLIGLGGLWWWHRSSEPGVCLSRVR